MNRAALSIAVCLLFASVSPGAARAASIGLVPAVKVLTCGASACDSLSVQVTLGPAELDADSFAFDIEVSDAATIDMFPGLPVGDPATGFSGAVQLLFDGVTIRGLLDSLPSSFDGPAVIEIATLDLSRNNAGAVQLTFADLEVACTTCAGGLGVIYPTDNTPGQLLALIVPEPHPYLLLAFALFTLALLRGGRAR